VNFREAESYLFSLGNEVSAMKLGLENIGKLLDALGEPQKKYLKVQIAGTNGKGSVCAFLDSICNTAGIRTGTFTSPHLISITERIRINGNDIDEDDFARYSTLVRETSEKLVEKGILESVPTFFEQITALALTAFADANVEVAVVETGLGGRLDATTAATAEIAVITRIDLDHQEYLGETIEEIAAEKAAIIHQGSRVVIGEQEPIAMDEILRRCEELGIIPLTECEAGHWAIDVPNRSVVAFFKTPRVIYDDPNLGLSGRHQLENARIAVLVADALHYDFGLAIDKDNVNDGLETARHPGRLEFHGRYLFDGAHNIGGANALREFIEEFVADHVTLVFGAMNDKDVGEIAQILFPLADELILTQSENSRAVTAKELGEFVPETISQKRITLTDTVSEALRIANQTAASDSIILVTGSLYLVGEVKKLLKHDPEFEI
jgi:dihydrofolate synthase/folylpolyglutamate synthase